MVYASRDPSTCLLEIRVNLDLRIEILPDDYVLIRAELEAEVEELPHEELEGYLADRDRSSAFGDVWLNEKRTPVLAVPSVIMPESTNYLINPSHPAFGAEGIEITYRPFTLDPRLF